MKLKALEIQGFKSFADKTRLTFDKPITCVVGPNGSGKSNISDAILWVTGEQSSKALRGGKMEDVIFGGTQKRSQMNYAEVSLILDNTDGKLPLENTEIMITRRYYRSGDSEYYINKSLCRLRDVNELLMDTGMGREGYSIIGQGRIDEILSAKSTDRRAIFEEAAGISRYRHRKEESERKLAKTEENLTRVNDKISELELQVEPLRAQAETAKKYLLLRDELRVIEISLWVDSLEKLSDELIRLKTLKVETDVQLVEAKREVEEFFAESEKFSERIHVKDIEAEEIRNEISLNDTRAAELDSLVAVLTANLESNAAEAARIENELSEQQDRDQHITEQIEERKLRISEIEKSLDDLEKKSRSINEEMEKLTESAGEAEKQFSKLLNRESMITDHINSVKNEISALASAAQEMEDRDVSAARDAMAAAERLEGIQKEADKCNEDLKKAQAEAASVENVIKGYNMRADNRRRKAADAEERYRRLEMDYQALLSRISLLTEMEKEYQGYSKAVKTVMQESSRGTLKGVHGTVGSLIKVGDKFALAIETALGGAMQNIIVTREEDGKAAINMLKRRDAGRATFEPLSRKGSVLHENGLGDEEGFEGLAIDLVTFDEQYNGVFTSLLGRCAVVENLDDAIRISRKYGSRFRIVTLDGQVMNAGGSMTGGSATKNAGILSRSNELEALSQRKQGFEEQLREAEGKRKATLAELEESEHELSVTRERQRGVQENVLKLESDSRHYEILLAAAKESIETLKSDSAALKARLDANANEIAACREKSAELENELADVQGKTAKMAEGREEIAAKFAEYNSKLFEIRETQASLNAEKTAETSSAEELERLRLGLAGGRDRQASYIEELKTKFDEIKDEITVRRRQSDEIAQSTARLKARIEKITEEKLEIEGERTRHNRQSQDKNNHLLNLERENSLIEQKMIASEMEEKQIIDKLWDTYELSRSEAIKQHVELENTAESKKQATELKRSISRLGNPNLGAIDEFERVNSRYTYLTEQRDDIEKAKNELTDIISDITDEMKEIFSVEFKNINAQFKETFLELFGGGRADLELEDENDILNCGIEIKVQPPGKSLKTITLLSGGEKAFVAIALYFAVLKVRPAPFVVMDEIEAALDEANVRRFSDYMRQMSEGTQMVVITHRRGTMEEADVLYGVTMQEQGVSRVLDIDLEEAERTISEN